MKNIIQMPQKKIEIKILFDNLIFLNYTLCMKGCRGLIRMYFLKTKRKSHKILNRL
jgi:hypothetical protein